MVHSKIRTTNRYKGVKRVVSVVMASVLAASGMQHVASAAPEANAAVGGTPYNPIDAYTHFNVVAFGDLHQVAESEGPVAVGGKFSWGQTQVAVKQDSEAALVVKGGINWQDSTGVLSVDGTGDYVTGNPLDVNLDGSVALDIDSNGANRQIDIVQAGGSYGDVPHINLNNNAPAAADVAYDTKWDSLLNQGAAISVADTLAAQSAEECLADDVLKKVENENAANGNEPAYWLDGDQTYIKLAENGQNIWNLTAAEFDSIGSLTFRSPAPTAANPLFINVAGTDLDFDFNQAGVDPDNNSAGILWNFYEAENLKLTGDSITGSVLAPNAHFDKDAANVDGNIIVASGDLRGSEQHHFSFGGQFTPCEDDEGPTTEPTTEPSEPEEPTDPEGPVTTTVTSTVTTTETTTETPEPTTVTTTVTEDCDCETVTETTTETAPVVTKTTTETVTKEPTTTTVVEPGETTTVIKTTTETEPATTETTTETVSGEPSTTTVVQPGETVTETTTKLETTTETVTKDPVTTTETVTAEPSTTTVVKPGEKTTVTETTTKTEAPVTETTTKTVTKEPTTTTVVKPGEKTTVTATKTVSNGSRPTTVTVTETVTGEPTTTEPTDTTQEPGEPTTTPSGPTSTPSQPGSSDVIGQCISNTSSVTNPVAWLIPIGMLAGIGHVAQPLIQPIIDSLIAEANAAIAEMTPNLPAGDVGITTPEYGNELAAELQSTINAINAELGKIAAGVPQEAIAAALVAAGVIAAGVAYDQCVEQGYIGHDFAQE